jgi:anti-sigma factor RsiW
MSCVQPIVLADHAKGRLAARRARKVEAHLAECAACRQAMARISGAQAAMRAAPSLLDPPAREADASSPRAEATLRWARLPAPSAGATSRRWAMGIGLAAAGVAFAVVGYVAADRLFGHPKGRAVATVAPPIAPPPSPPSSPVAEVRQALVTMVGGRAEASSPMVAPRALVAGGRVVEGETLRAPPGGMVAVQWGDGDGALVRPRVEAPQVTATLALTALAADAQRLALGAGRVDVRVKHRTPSSGSDAPILAVQTPGHVVSVRGTWFAVAAWQDGGAQVTSVEVYEGAVEIAERDGPGVTLLRAPSRGTFVVGAGAGGGARRARASTQPLSAREAAALKLKSELNLVARWPAAGVGRLSIAADPVGMVAVDGVELGTAPLSILKSEGRHLVEIVRRGFQPLRRWVTVGPEPEELRASLAPLPPPSPAPAAPPPRPDFVDEMVRARGHKIRACYERALKREPTLSGAVSLKLRIDDVGRVAAVSVESTTLEGDAGHEVAECMRREVRGWSFSSGRNATIVYPFVFRSQ